VERRLVEELRPEMLKELDIVGLSWPTRLFNVAWGSGTVPMDRQTGVVVPIFKKVDCQSKKFDVRRLRPRVRLQIQDQQSGSVLLVEPWTSSLPS